MGSVLNRVSYEKLIKDDIAWLLNQPRSPERDHILLVLEKAVDYEYGKEKKDFTAKPQRAQRLKRIWDEIIDLWKEL